MQYQDLHVRKRLIDIRRDWWDVDRAKKAALM
jgi:hypothetical protein